LFVRPLFSEEPVSSGLAVVGIAVRTLSVENEASITGVGAMVRSVRVPTPITVLGVKKMAGLVRDLPCERDLKGRIGGVKRTGQSGLEGSVGSFRLAIGSDQEWPSCQGDERLRPGSF
jgi:hypothetical protein